jgi:hypothetical protein
MRSIIKSIIKKQPKQQPAGCCLEGKTEKMCQPYLGLDRIPLLLLGEGIKG